MTEARDRIDLETNADSEDAVELRGHHQAAETATASETPTHDLEVRRHAAVAAGLGLAGSALAIAYLVRASSTGSLLDWALCAFMAAVGGLHLYGLVDARSPLLVADEQGLRMRRGRTWHGVPWSSVERIEHLERRGPLRDGRLTVRGADDLTWSVRLGLSTRVVGLGAEDLTEALTALAGDATEVVEVDVVAADAVADDSLVVEGLDEHDDSDATDPHDLDDATDEEPTPPADRRRPAFASRLASPTPSPLRALVNAARSESRRDHAASLAPATETTVGATALRLDHAEETHVLPEAVVLRRDADSLEDTALWGNGIAPVRDSDDVTIVIDDLASVPISDPVIGPELASARSRIGLSVDQLAERTRIRPHVIESIEVDDFAPCGGDFYARGHLRTLARVLGVDVAPLLASYDERYADAPVDPRRVFEAELATGFNGSIRGTRGGPNWSVLIAAVMAVILVWSIARLVMDGPVPIADTPRLNNSQGINNGTANAGPKVPVVLTAAGGGAVVVVRDGSGTVVFDGDVAFMQSIELQVVPPVRVQSTDGSLTVSVDGEDRGALGATGQEAQDTFVVTDE